MKDVLNEQILAEGWPIRAWETSTELLSSKLVERKCNVCASSCATWHKLQTAGSDERTWGSCEII